MGNGVAITPRRFSLDFRCLGDPCCPLVFLATLLLRLLRKELFKLTAARWKRIVLLALVALLVVVGAVLLSHRSSGRNQILLGAALPLTGSYAQYGTVPRNAIELALEQRKKAGFPYSVTIQYEDTELRPNLALTAVRKLIDIHHV